MTLRDELIASATRLLDDGGPEKVTLREVGRLAGVSRTAPYRHFTSKSDLLATVAARELDRLVDGIAAPAEPPAALEVSLSAAMLRFLTWARNRPERFRLVFGHWAQENDALREAAARANRALVDLVAGSQGSGALPPGDPWNVAAVVRAFLHGAAALEQNGHLLGPDRVRLDAEELVGTFLSRASGGRTSVSARPAPTR
jgi:AcrR family transcriptional regulator